MSIHYDKFSLNTYKVTPYFHVHIPEDYPINLVLQKCRAFRRLPPNLRKLSALAKQWAIRVYGDTPGSQSIDDYYDEEGYELGPEGERLTDEEIDAMWPWPEPEIEVKDIPEPPGGFADPDTWEEPPEPEEPELVDRDGMTEEELLNQMYGRSHEDVAWTYGVPKSWLKDVKSDEDLVRMILDMDGKPWPERKDDDEALSNT